MARTRSPRSRSRSPGRNSRPYLPWSHKRSNRYSMSPERSPRSEWGRPRSPSPRCYRSPPRGYRGRSPPLRYRSHTRSRSRSPRYSPPSPLTRRYSHRPASRSSSPSYPTRAWSSRPGYRGKKNPSHPPRNPLQDR